jgi:hypothetical protein
MVFLVKREASFTRYPPSFSTEDKGGMCEEMIGYTVKKGSRFFLQCTLCFLAKMAVMIMRLLITVRTVRADMMAIWRITRGKFYSFLQKIYFSDSLAGLPKKFLHC